MFFLAPRSLLGSGLGLFFSTGLLHAILGVFLGTSSRSFLLTSQACALQAVLGLKLLQLLQILIDQAETTAASTSKSCLEAKELDALNVMNFVHTAELFSQILLGDIGHARMNHIQNELLASQQGVVLELSGANGELRHGVRRLVRCWRSLLPEPKAMVLPNMTNSCNSTTCDVNSPNLTFHSFHFRAPSAFSNFRILCWPALVSQIQAPLGPTRT